MQPLVRYRGGFRWAGVPVEPYKADGTQFRDVSRQVLFGADPGAAGELRYFEVEPAGWTTLERHAHVHQVMVLRGRGRALAGTSVFDVEPFDLVRVPSDTWHQFRAAVDAPLGFLCLVDRERDRPVRPNPQELAALRADPRIADFVRT